MADVSLSMGVSADAKVADLLCVLEISRQLAVTTDAQQLLAQIEQAALKVFDCERATVFVFDSKTNELYSYVAARAEPLRFPADQGIAGACFQNGQAINVPDAYQDPRFNRAIDDKTGFRTGSLLACPLLTYDRAPIGVLQVLNKRGGKFNQWDETLLGALSAQCGVALQRQFLLEQFAEKQRIQRELKIARTIQQGLLPKRAPALEGFDIAGWSQPAEETGGDFFHYQPLNDGRLMLAVADVAGHGVAPALLAAQCYALQKATFALLPEIQQGVTLVNRLLSEDIPDDRFVTVFFAFLSSTDSELVFTSAGHGPVLWFRAKERRMQELPVHGPPLGVMSDMVYEGWDRIRFDQDDILVALTDGFFEWVNPEGKPFGVQRIGEIVKRHQRLPAAEIIQRIYHELAAYVKSVPQTDDLTAVIVKRT